MTARCVFTYIMLNLLYSFKQTKNPLRHRVGTANTAGRSFYDLLNIDWKTYLNRCKIPVNLVGNRLNWMRQTTFRNKVES